jgi:hypothetical protein
VAVAAAGLLVMTIAPYIPAFRNLVAPEPTTWEYRVVNINPDVLHDRGVTTTGALAQNQITVSDAQLNALGLQGWELTGSYLEIETAFRTSAI